MSDEPEIDAGSALAEATTTPAGAPESAVQADAAPSWDDRALQMGWTPKEQFRGDPDKWVDAETFVRRGEEFLPFVKANNKRLERELEKANGQIAKLKGAVDNAVQHISRADQRAYERARRELEADLDRAAEAGDIASVRAINKDIVDLEKEVRAEAKPEHVAETPDGKAALSEFKVANPWFEKDRVMTAAAIEIGNELAAEGVLEPRIQLAEIAKRIRAEFPHKFTNPRREQAAAVEGASLGSKPRGKGYADLPADARQMCDELVRDKIITREKYVSEFFKEATR